MFSAILSNRSFLISLDSLRPGGLSGALDTIFGSESVRAALSATVRLAPLLRREIDTVKAVRFGLVHLCS